MHQDDENFKNKERKTFSVYYEGGSDEAHGNNHTNGREHGNQNQKRQKIMKMRTGKKPFRMLIWE